MPRTMKLPEMAWRRIDDLVPLWGRNRIQVVRNLVFYALARVHPLEAMRPGSTGPTGPAGPAGPPGPMGAPGLGPVLGPQTFGGGG
jgi:hypothetical protein